MMGSKDWQKQARSLIHQATLAPSSHNTQPWVFRISDFAISLYADRTRALPVNDPEDRELIISCGCALMNLRIAATNNGLAVGLELFPDSEDRDLLARLSFSESANEQSEQLAELERYIGERSTYRRKFVDREVSSDEIQQLAAAAEREGAQFQPILTSEARDELASLVAAGDTELWSNLSWRRELAMWMHTRRRGDGIVVPGLVKPITQAVIRSFDMGSRVAAKNQDLVKASPLLAVLSTANDNVNDWLAVGQALQCTLLGACRLGLQASYLNQAVQVNSSRMKLGEMLADGFPQIVLRIGYPMGRSLPTPRRPLADVIE